MLHRAAVGMRCAGMVLIGCDRAMRRHARGHAGVLHVRTLGAA
jgi:hypothetical protein